MLTSSSLRIHITSAPEAVADSLLKFFSRPETEIIQEHVRLRDGSVESREVQVQNPMPTVEEWCVQHRMTRATLERFAGLHPIVAEALEFARGAMKVYLIKNGLNGKYDARIVTFVASNETDMKIKAESTLVVKNPDDILSQIEAGEKTIVEGKLIDKKPKQLK